MCPIDWSKENQRDELLLKHRLEELKATVEDIRKAIGETEGPYCAGMELFLQEYLDEISEIEAAFSAK